MSRQVKCFGFLLKMNSFILEVLDVDSALFPGKCCPETGELVDLSHYAFKKSDLVTVSENKYDQKLCK